MGARVNILAGWQARAGATGRGFGLLALVAGGLMACSPQEAIYDVTRQAAGRVAEPIVANYVPPAQVLGVTRCVLDAASEPELRSLAQDLGTRGGSRPQDNVLALAARPAARSCIAAAGLQQIPALL